MEPSAATDETRRLPPTSVELFNAESRPYFLWWVNATVGKFQQKLLSPDVEERAYWLGALLREANTRDVWIFTTPTEVRALWPHLVRFLGRSRPRWAWLLDLEDPGWPPASIQNGGHA